MKKEEKDKLSSFGKKDPLTKIEEEDKDDSIDESIKVDESGDYGSPLRKLDKDKTPAKKPEAAAGGQKPTPVAKPVEKVESPPKLGAGGAAHLPGRVDEEKKKAEEAKLKAAEDAKKAEELKKKAEDLKKKADEEKKKEEERKKEEAKKERADAIVQMRAANEAQLAASEAQRKKAEEAKKAQASSATASGFTDYRKGNQPTSTQSTVPSQPLGTGALGRSTQPALGGPAGPTPPSNLKSRTDMQAGPKSVTISDKVSINESKEARESKLSMKREQYAHAEKNMHPPSMSIYDEFKRNEGENQEPRTSHYQLSLPIEGLDAIPRMDTKHNKKALEAARLLALRGSDTESAFYKQPLPDKAKELHLLEIQKNEEKRVLLDLFVKNFCNSTQDLLQPVAGMKGKSTDTLIDRFSKTMRGFINYEEFKKVYSLVCTEVTISAETEDKLQYCWRRLDANNSGKISKHEFSQMITNKDLALNMLEKMKSRMDKGEHRLAACLKIAFDGSDLNFNQNGLLPWPVFQTIMRDYNLPIIDDDRPQLELVDVMVKDEEGDFFVNYKKLLDGLMPKDKDMNEEDLVLATMMIQRCWRKFTDQKAKLPATRKGTTPMSGLQKRDLLLAMGEVGLGCEDGGILSPATTATPGSKKDRRRTKETVMKERAEQQRRARIDRGKQNDLLGKMEQVVKVQKDTKTAGNLRLKKDLVDFIKNSLLGDILNNALCYGESLKVCRTLQTNFENRPVNKSLFPTLKDFEYIVQGVQPKSLQAIDSLGEIMFLDNQNQLQRYELASQKTKPNPMNLGTRPPLKHYPIIDMVSDQRSGRIYTLNANWILEIWDINQQQESTEVLKEESANSDAGSKFFPVKRIAVCNNEGGKDFISMFYRQTFNNSKPKFLSLQESNQQILLVNTSCVDGSIVFIDPISFSVLKKVTLRYQDYEIPRDVRKSILFLKRIFEQIQKDKGLTMTGVFQNIVDHETEEIKIKGFVEQLISLEVDQTREELYQAIQVLDKDNDGAVSLDEFLNFFGEVKDESEMDEYAKAQEEQLMQDELWPTWLIREGKLQQAQNLFANMYHHLSTVHGITMQSAFALYDARDEGAISEEQFKLIVSIFFTDLLTEEETTFLLRLTVARTDKKIFYREFCKFMEKKIVKTYKDVAIRKKRDQASGQAEMDQVEQTPLEALISSPLRKEATLTYVLRHAAKLHKDLRKDFVTADPLELSVISRTEFNGLIIGMPLGLDQQELDEIFENDLNYDNYGNVDYVQVLNSDLFVALERRRIKEKATKRAEEFQRRRIQKQSIIANQKAERARVRKSRGLTSSVLESEATGQLSSQQFSGTHASSALSEDSEEMELEDNTASLNLADNRKVVVEDLIYLDDQQIIVYSTVSPRTSTLFVTSLQKTERRSKEKNERGQEQPVLLGDLTSRDMRKTLAAIELQKEKKRMKKDNAEEQLLTNHYQLLAKLVGHKNSDPPSMLYVPESGCLVTGEKYSASYYEQEQGSDRQSMSKAGTVPTTQGTKKDTNVYDSYSKSHHKNNQKCEIIVWNLQRDMVELFSLRPPWNVPIFRRFTAHDGSIIDMAYLQKSQLIVSCSVDKSIRFWDPATMSYDLSDPGNHPSAQSAPGQYKPLKRELTNSNAPFKEVRRIYTSNNICFALKPLRIKDVVLDPLRKDIKSSVEWIVCLSLARPLPYHSPEAKAAQAGFLVGFGVERLQISVPAKHHDEIVPPYITKQAQDMIQTRRAKIVDEFYKTLPLTLQDTFEQNQKQAAQIEKVRQLFMQAILNRVEGKYVNPEPLREIYQIILKLPARNQFQGFLASSGCSDKLSVSETFLYLQKFMQVHPLRTTQIEFEKSIGDFYYRHQRQYLQGIKRWAKPGLQKMADYVRKHGIDVGYFKGISEQSTDPFAQRLMLTFCTREKIQDYFNDVVKVFNTDQRAFTDQEIDLVLQELDPYNTGVIQINQIKMLFIEEITHYFDVKANKPQHILQKLRSEAFPSKRIALQKALSEVDKEGDGYLSKKLFIEAIYDAGIYMVRDDVEYLFDVMSEIYHKAPEEKADLPEHTTAPPPEHEEEEEAPAKQFTEKYLFLPYFCSKLYHKQELRDLNEVDGTLSLLKSAMIYKGLAFDTIFAENYMDVEAMKRARSKKDVDVDFQAVLKKTKKKIEKEDFIRRVLTIQAQNADEVQVRRLANFMALNQENPNVIYREAWTHQLRRSKHSLHIADRDAIPVMCAKLLRNLSVFQSQLSMVGISLKNAPNDYKMVEINDLKTILGMWNFTYVSQALFLEEFTRRGQVHVEEMMSRMKDKVRKYYETREPQLLAQQRDGLLDSVADPLPIEAQPRYVGKMGTEKQFEPSSLDEIITLPFVQRVLKKLKKVEIAVDDLTKRFARFDLGFTNYLPAHKIVGVLYHNFVSVFDGETACALQFELECLNKDHQVDYHEFIEAFFGGWTSGKNKNKKNKKDKKDKKDKKKKKDKDKEDKPDKKDKKAHKLEDFMTQVSEHVLDRGYDIASIVGLFGKQTGWLSYDQMRQVFKLLEYPISEKDFAMVTSYLDDNQDGMLKSHDVVDKVKYAAHIATEYWPRRWEESTFLLDGRHELLDMCSRYFPNLMNHMEEYHSYTFKSHIDDETNQVATVASIRQTSSVLCGSDFQQMLRTEIPQMAENDIKLLTTFCIRGSQNIPEGERKSKKKVRRGTAFDCDVENDYIQVSYFRSAVQDSIRAIVLEKQEIETERQNAFLDKAVERRVDDEISQKRQLHRLDATDSLRAKKPTAEQQEHLKAYYTRARALVEKVQDIFLERECTFFDAFKDVYDPLARVNRIPVYVFKDKVQKLSLPLTVQDHRILRRIALDPDHIGHVDLKKFCPLFESVQLKKMRLNRILDSIATQFYMKNFNLRKAFSLFDLNRTGKITLKAFRQAVLQLDLQLSYDELEDIVAMVSTKSDGIKSKRLDEHVEIIYDDFILALDDNIRKRKKEMGENLEDQVMRKLFDALEDSGQSFYDVLKVFDLEGDETVLTQDLERVFKNLGIPQISPHLPWLLEVGGVRKVSRAGDAHQTTVDIMPFSAAILKEMCVRVERSARSKYESLIKLHSLMQQKQLSLFDLFVRLDRRGVGRLEKIELRTGIANMGMTLTTAEFDTAWKAVHKFAKLSKSFNFTPTITRDEGNRQVMHPSMLAKTRPPVQTVSYTDLIKAFTEAGCVEVSHVVDKPEVLIKKMRTQLKRLDLSVEQAYKRYDNDGHGFVFRDDFLIVSEMIGLEFEEFELLTMFEYTCSCVIKITKEEEYAAAMAKPNQRREVASAKALSTQKRFDKKQFVKTVEMPRDDVWLNHTFIRIHSVVLQRKLSYKRLFLEWQIRKAARPKKAPLPGRKVVEKKETYRLTRPELVKGLGRLQAGLTLDEIEKLCDRLPFDYRLRTIAADDFKDQILEGVETLDRQEAYDKMILVKWINTFNDTIESSTTDLSTLFHQFDVTHKGGFVLEEFCNMNEFIGTNFERRDLRKVFAAVAKGEEEVRIEQIRIVLAMNQNFDDGEKMVDIEQLPIYDFELKKNEILVRQQVNDIYESMKNIIQTKNMTFDHILYNELNFVPVQVATEAGFVKACDKLGISVNALQARRIMGDLKNANNGKLACSWKQLIDFLTKARINVTYMDKGFVDPMLATSVNQLQLVSEFYSMSMHSLFNVFDPDRSGDISKQEFIMNIQGMNVNLTLEEILELFNFIDSKDANRVTVTQFKESMAFLINKMGGQNLLESSQAAKNILQSRKKVANTQLVFQILGEMCDHFIQRQYMVKELMVGMDLNKTGYVSRPEFATFVNSLTPTIPLESVRQLMNFFDHKQEGKVSVTEFTRLCQELMNQKIGGGVFLQLQAQPIVEKIINQLSVDCDKFFDEVADLNEIELKAREEQWQAEIEEINEKNRVAAQLSKDKAPPPSKEMAMLMKYKNKDSFSANTPGLSKSVFFKQVERYGIQLAEQDKSILSGVFSLDGMRGNHLMNYEKLDLIFEGVQQQLYCKDSLYTNEWERSIFSKLGQYIMKENETLHGMFRMVKGDDSCTRTIEEIKEGIQEFDLVSVSERDLAAFLKRIDSENIPPNSYGTGQLTGRFHGDPRTHKFVQKASSSVIQDDRTECYEAREFCHNMKKVGTTQEYECLGHTSCLTQEEFISRFWSALSYEDAFDCNKERDLEDIIERAENGPYAPLNEPLPVLRSPKGKRKMFSPDKQVMMNRFAQPPREPEPPVDNPIAQLELYPHNIAKARCKMISDQDREVHLLSVFKNVQNAIKTQMSAEEAFDKMDPVRRGQNGSDYNLGFLTLWNFQANFAKNFELSISKDDVRALFKEIDINQNGIITFKEFEKFYQEDFIVKQIEQEKECELKNTSGEIFYHLLKVIHNRGLTLHELFQKIDVDKNNFVEAEEFHDLLNQMGFPVPKGQVLDLLRKADENFDGRISYKELKIYLISIGFNVEKLEQGNDKITDQHKRDKERQNIDIEFVWRDKALEIIITKLNWKLKLTHKDYCKKQIQSVKEYFGRYDDDMDTYLTPTQFRQALLDLDESRLLRIQIERILHVLLDHTKPKPLISIARIQSLLLNYKFLEMGDGKGSQSVLIDEDLFVYIVERYDGLSRFLYLNAMVEDRSSYLERHVHELDLRGLQLMSNQKTVQVLQSKNKQLAELNQSALVLMSSEISRLIKDEAQMCCLDPTYNIDYIVTDWNQGALASTSIPQIENTDFDIYWRTGQLQNNGAIAYNAELMKNKQKVDVLIYPADVLSYVSQDGKTYKKHLLLEQQTQRYLMGVQFNQYSDSEDEDPKQASGVDEANAEVFGTLGKFEKKVEAGTNDTDVYIINKVIDQNQWICFDEFVHQNGGLLNVPMLYHTDAPLYVIRYWAKMILKIISKVHDVAIVLRCLNTKQLWFSRDGQKIKLGHVRGVGKINNFGCIKEASDIQINLVDNGVFDIEGDGIPRDGSKRQKQDRQKVFSNQALDNPFLAPENLFSKFQDHTAAMDVWGFGMVLYCLLLGKKPKSFYATYRDWYKKSHGVDLDEMELPSGSFVRPSKKNFIYDPFAFDFENPFNAASSVDPDISPDVMEKLRRFSEAAEVKDPLLDTKPEGDFDFANFMKCINQLSYSAMFSAEHSTKFNLRSLDQLAKARAQNVVPRFSGIQTTSEQTRMQSYTRLAAQEILARKNELGLILDTIGSCLEMDPKKRPTIRGLLTSPLFDVDMAEQTHYQRLCQSAILYRSPASSVSMRITQPLRQICAEAIASPYSLYVNEDAIQQLFLYAEDSVKHHSHMPLDEIDSLVTMREKRRGLVDSAMNNLKGKETGDYSVSPNAPLAAQIVKDNVVDMLLFITFRYLRNFAQHKTKRVAEINRQTEAMIQEFGEKMAEETAQQNKLLRDSAKVPTAFQKESAAKQVAKTAGRKLELDRRVQNMLINSKRNHVLTSMARLLKSIVHEMHAYNTPMAPYAREVLTYMVKFFTGEEHMFGSTLVLERISAQVSDEAPLKHFLEGHSFFRNEDDLTEDFKSDRADKLFFLDQKNKDFLGKSNHWCLDLHHEAVKIYRDAIDEQGMGQSCYPVLSDYIKASTDAGEPSRVFSSQMNKLSQSFLTPMERTKDYYNELVPITESIARLSNTSEDKGQDKRTALAMIRSTFQTGNSDKIKACLDMRVPKHIIHFLQDSKMEVRQETLLILKEISRGLQDEDFEILTKNAVNIKQEFTKSVFQQTAFDRHKPISMASQAEVLDEEYKKKKRGRQSHQNNTGCLTRKQGDGHRCCDPDGIQVVTEEETQMKEYLRRIQLSEKEQNEKFIYFALDLPNLNFLACKPFLKELAVCFESPVFIAPLIRLLKTDSTKESFANKQIILDIVKNLVCGNEKVLIALNSPACDTYMTLLGLLRRNQKAMNARASASGMTSQIRHTLELQDKAIELFKFIFEQRRPTIIRDLMNIAASETLLKEQEMGLPQAITLPDLMHDFDTWSDTWFLAYRIKIPALLERIKDLRCWIKHFFDKSKIPILTRTKALQRCMNFLIHAFRLSWKDYFKQKPKELPKQSPKLSAEEERLVAAARKAHEELPSVERKQHYLILMRNILQLFDWVLTQNHEIFLFGAECGPENLSFVIETTNQVLSQFRTPTPGIITVSLEDLTFNKKANKKIQNTRRFDIFPLTVHGTILQNIEYQLVRMNKPHINELLSKAKFGITLGQQLLLDYDFMGHCIDNCVESMVLLGSYVKKNEIRLNTIEFLLKSHDNTLKEQFLKSNFLEKVMMDHIHDFREFNIQQSRIEVEFLAFRKGYPLRQEAISIFNTVLLNRKEASQVYSELIMHARRHKLVEQEADLIKHGQITIKETTSLLLFAIILEVNEKDLIYVMQQENVPKRMNEIMKEQPSLTKRFPILATHTTNLYSGQK